MSRTTQAKFFDHLEKIVAKHELDLRVDFNYSNNGIGYIEAETQLTPVLIFRWSASGQAYFIFRSEPVALEKAPHGMHDVSNGELDELLTRINEFLSNL